jgi:hypothetical protein
MLLTSLASLNSHLETTIIPLSPVQWVLWLLLISWYLRVLDRMCPLSARSLVDIAFFIRDGNGLFLTITLTL